MAAVCPTFVNAVSVPRCRRHQNACTWRVIIPLEKHTLKPAGHQWALILMRNQESKLQARETEGSDEVAVSRVSAKMTCLHQESRTPTNVTDRGTRYTTQASQLRRDSQQARACYLSKVWNQSKRVNTKCFLLNRCPSSFRHGRNRFQAIVQGDDFHATPHQNIKKILKLSAVSHRAGRERFLRNAVA